MAWSRWVSLLFGATLIIIAALKLIAPGETPGLPLISTWEGRVGAIGVEFFVGSWLVSRVACRGAWLAGLVLFVALACISTVLVLTGQSSCGCLGAVVQTSPVYTLAFDVVAVALIATSYPPGGDWFGPVGPLAIGTGVLLATAYAVMSLVGVPAEILARLAGQSVLVSPEVTLVDGGRSGDQRTVVLSVSNLSDQPLRLVGSTSDCSCVATTALPVDLKPGERVTVPILVTLWGSPGAFTRHFVIYTDGPNLRGVVARVSGRVDEE